MLQESPIYKRDWWCTFLHVRPTCNFDTSLCEWCRDVTLKENCTALCPVQSAGSDLVGPSGKTATPDYPMGWSVLLLQHLGLGGIGQFNWAWTCMFGPRAYNPKLPLSYFSFSPAPPFILLYPIFQPNKDIFVNNKFVL